MTDITTLHRELIARVLDGAAESPTALRRAAFENNGLDEPIRSLVDKVADHSYQVTDDDVAAVRSAGFSEDQVFELVVCAAVGQGSRQYNRALDALASAGGAAQ